MSKVAMSFRVDESLRDSFIAKCKAEDIPASVAIREFMKSFIRQTPNAETIQAMQDMENGVNIAKFDSIEALKADLLSD